jgi:hypothetical protein
MCLPIARDGRQTLPVIAGFSSIFLLISMISSFDMILPALGRVEVL